MSYGRSQKKRRLLTIGGTIALGMFAALAVPACASKEKLVDGPTAGMGSVMMPSSTTSSYETARQVASDSAGGPRASRPSDLPSISGMDFAR